MSEARVRISSFAVLAALLVYAGARLDLTNSIVHFLPSREGTELVRLSIEMVESPLARRMILAIGGDGSGADPAAERARLATALAGTLRSHPEVAWAETGFGEAAVRGLYEVYFERRIYFVSEEPVTETPGLFTAEALETSAAQLRRRLARPDSILVSQTAPADPLGFFERALERIRLAQPALSSAGGSFTSTDGETAIVLVGLRSSPFDSQRQASLLEHAEEEFARLAAGAGGGLHMELSGVNRIAVASERGVRRDIDFISAVSIAGVCVLFWVAFRSLRALLLAILPAMVGFAAATAVVLTISSPIHGITLGFGFALIGVAIDYPIHLMNHHAFSAAGTRPRETASRIRSSLVLSALTTALAFAALALSDFPGLGDMGGFAAVGVPAALIFTLLSIPAFLPPDVQPTRAQRAMSRAFLALVAWLQVRRRLAYAVPATFAAVAAVGLSQLQWDDDPATLMAADPVLLAEDERVRDSVLDVDGGRFVVGLAADRQSALELNDRIDGRLAVAVAAGHLDGYRSLHAFLWSEALQRENLSALQSLPDLGERIDTAFARSGFRSGAFERFGEAVASPLAEPLRPADLAGSPLERILDALVELDGRFAVVTYLRGVRSGDALRAALEDLESTHYVDQQEIISSLYEEYRRSTLRMIAIAGAVVFVLLQIRYRRFRYGLLASLPSVLSALATLGVFGLVGLPVNVVGSISLVIVLGMGVDYGIFTVDGARRPERLGATMASLLVSCLTTAFVFGTLALSDQPSLRAIGLTTSTGIVLALVLAPAVFVLASPGRGAES